MKHLFSLMLSFWIFSVTAGNEEIGIQWMSFEEVQSAQLKEPRKVFIDVYTNWCGPCKIMSNTTLKDSTIVKYLNENFYSIKFNAETDDDIEFKGKIFSNPNYNPLSTGRNSVHQLTFDIAATEKGLMYPTTVYMDEQMNILTKVPGMRDVTTLHMILSYFETGSHLTMSWEDWQNHFMQDLAK